MYDNIYFGTVFVAGLVSFFAPCIIPLLPIYIGMLSDKKKSSKHFKIGKSTIYVYTLVKSLAFVLGLSTTFVMLGFGAGWIGSLVTGKTFITIMGFIVILLGLHQTGLVRIKKLEGEKKLNLKRSYKSDVLGSYLLGFTFSFGWTPCIGPVLGSIIGLASTSDTAYFGALMMLTYSLGLAIPFLIISLFSDVLLTRASGMKKHMKKFKIVGGILIILMGVLMIAGQVNEITAFFEKFF